MPVETALLERTELFLGGVITHIADVRTEQQLSTECAEQPNLVVDGLKISRIPGYVVANILSVGIVAMCRATILRSRASSTTLGTVGRMCEHVHAALNSNLCSCQNILALNLPSFLSPGSLPLVGSLCQSTIDAASSLPPPATG